MATHREVDYAAPVKFTREDVVTDLYWKLIDAIGRIEKLEAKIKHVKLEEAQK